VFRQKVRIFSDLGFPRALRTGGNEARRVDPRVDPLVIPVSLGEAATTGIVSVPASRLLFLFLPPASDMGRRDTVGKIISRHRLLFAPTAPLRAAGQALNRADPSVIACVPAARGGRTARSRKSRSVDADLSTDLLTDRPAG
jgi:hypothetical protein